MLEEHANRSADHNPHERSIIQLTETQLKTLVTEGVYDALTRLGVDAQNPVEMQKDFQHLRDWRKATSEVQKKSLCLIVGILLSGLCAAAWLGIKAMILAAPSGPTSP